MPSGRMRPRYAPPVAERRKLVCRFVPVSRSFWRRTHDELARSMLVLGKRHFDRFALIGQRPIPQDRPGWCRDCNLDPVLEFVVLIAQTRMELFGLLARNSLMMTFVCAKAGPVKAQRKVRMTSRRRDISIGQTSLFAWITMMFNQIVTKRKPELGRAASNQWWTERLAVRKDVSFTSARSRRTWNSKTRPSRGGFEGLPTKSMFSTLGRSGKSLVLAGVLRPATSTS